MKRIDFREVIEVFIKETIPSIKVENEIPNIDFIFTEKGYKLMEYVKEYPYNLKKRIEDEDIIRIRNYKLTSKYKIEINDPIKFFVLLTEIINEQIKLYNEYNDHIYSEDIIREVLSRIWLRMTKNDFKNVINFLNRELEFLKDRTLEKYRNYEKIDEYEGYDVLSYIEANPTWDETSKSIHFVLMGKESSHTVSHIHYAIKEENNEKVCYIYGVQNNLLKTTNKKIERKLYKLNKGIDITDVHPNQIFPLIELMKILAKEGIRTIKVPTNQELNYEYHKILSNTEKERFPLRWRKDLVERIYQNNDSESLMQRKAYEYEKKWHDNIVDSEDKIRELKTNKLFSLINRLGKHINNLNFIENDKSDNEILIYRLTK